VNAVPYDVVVLGAGNAGLCAALTARALGARVVVIESAPRHFRGGNSRHTRNLRVAHRAPTAVLPEAYPADEFWTDLLRVSGDTDEALARLVIDRSAECPAWMERNGVRFQSPLKGTLQLGRTNAFFLGGGKAAMNAYFATAERLGIDVRYDTCVENLQMSGSRFDAAIVRTPAGTEAVRARSVVLASGGFESNVGWLREAWGPAADNFIVRGTPFNTGRVLQVMLDAGAEPVGNARACHAVAVDARAPKFDGGIVTRLDSIPLGIVVNTDGQRFHDEGEDVWPKRYATWGALVAQQPGQLAFAITDQKVAGRFMPSVYPAIERSAWPDLAAALELPAAALESTVRAFNGAVRAGRFDHTQLDDCHTEGLLPPKSHWAQPLDAPPYCAYPLRPGITFTYLGVRVNAGARVLMNGEAVSENIFAAGEIMAGNVLRRGYVAGVGMTIGTVFGRIAGEGAARHALL
jgi:tricarballylate dehydrogenase